MKLSIVSKTTARETAPIMGLGIADTTGELIGLTARGVAFWEPIFRSRGMKFSRVMTFEQFAIGVQRFAVSDCSIIPFVEQMAPGHAKGFLCAAFGDNGAVCTHLLLQLAANKTRRVAFISKAAVGATPEDQDGSEPGTQRGHVVAPEILSRKRLQRRLHEYKVRRATLVADQRMNTETQHG